MWTIQSMQIIIAQAPTRSSKSLANLADRHRHVLSPSLGLAPLALNSIYDADALYPTHVPIIELLHSVHACATWRNSFSMIASGMPSTSAKTEPSKLCPLFSILRKMRTSSSLFTAPFTII
mmetsp:Transcript_8605/g.31771  ORF Transcript_8605/g.31771 Transcript_8605/m.31771 type:complete len:121 (+) Transcript_8605:937-1299(+)